MSLTSTTNPPGTGARGAYESRFPSTPGLERYLRDQLLTAPGETARDMIARIVGALTEADRTFGTPAAAEAFVTDLGHALDERRVVFSTPIMTNAGDRDRPLSACAVPPVDLRGDLEQAKTVIDGYHRAGMGTGFDLDDTDDPVAVLRHLNDVAVAGASSGAEDRPVGNMAILAIGHPRAAEFVACKRDADARGEQWRFNISLAVGDADMRAATDGPCRQRDLLAAAAEAAHACADPGLLYADRMNAANPTPKLGEYVSTAPCAEVGLVAGETCQFGYVNLGAFHDPGGAAGVPVDLNALAATVRVLVRALDNALELSIGRYPHALSATVMRAKRKIGVGVCGLADLLLAAGLPYDSPPARHLAQEVIAYVNHVSKAASVELAAERGACPAVLGGESRYADPHFLARFAGMGLRTVTSASWAMLAEQVAATGMLRHSSTIALPPTGRSAPVIAASTGIEPLFRLTDERLADAGHRGGLHPAARAALTGRPRLLAVALREGRLPDHDVPRPLAELLATATQISPGGHLAMAAAVQECVDEAVAKTVNLPADASVGDVRDIFQNAWELGCKGITVYRDSSRTVQPKAL